MTTRTRRSSARWAALGVLLGLGAAAGAAEAQTLIQSCPYTILAPGTYVLARDLICPDPAIAIAADNVRLDLGGRTLTSTAAGTGTGVRAEGSEEDPITGLRVENGTVTGFSLGVVLVRAPGTRLTRLTGVTAAGDGSGGIGILVNSSPDARIENNRATGFDEGISAGGRGCDRCRITGNRATGNADEGIILSPATGARVVANVADGNGFGIYLDSSGNDGNLVQGNTARGNTESGIYVGRGSTGNQLLGNLATGNGGVDLEDDNLPACVNAWLGNTFVTDNEGNGPGAGCIR
jgi:parallel beta-helix repeat protein